ncbi:glutathione ABC transporter substrate-binding protein [Shouchella clausii]|jgi:peptide/nickel transport system substrate-binding protein|uniref:glutathione ABC transporter substrate-binding protein n=1 Tax=Shouchella clausii TaxID=79880 RepID=UPI000B97BEBB|nr:glutathione ABC transporter substrate-binding protein [Shouchella clausii]AST94480.1 glutathione ABC transporter substrate-binding protein [Shouchella clausii]AST98478.1 glutathione ABC transporter substrate-binding protein [Shouchella clausii]MCR1290294.1 glutathione ABC transporter substrate-binding protein [Shouchella clausii]MEB5472989.1 glutathione ABC transporter substrate-binding protein [Shouchella clausii]PAF13224.1 glutathione ABC transporter substrate-binding protein [Shouchella 
MFKKNALWLAVAASAMLVVTACSNDPEQAENTSDEAENSASGAELTIDLSSDPVSLDPHGANDGNSLYVMGTLYNKLVEFDENNEIQPSLATSLEQIEDDVWEAKLREDVTFHDGSEFNAEVVKANLDRVRDPDLGSPVAFLFDKITDVEVIDEYTVHIHTDGPFSPLPSHLAHPAGGMISKEAIDADYEAIENGEPAFSYVDAHPIGTGFFELDSRTSGESVSVTRNEDYWDKDNLAKASGITFKTVPEEATRIAELQGDVADLIYPVNPSSISEIESAENTTVKQSPSSNLTYLGFNTEVEPFTDKRVRQAISMAIDKDSIINGLLDGVAEPAIGPLAPTVTGYSQNIDTFEYDQEEARQLLEEAGYEDGFDATLTVNSSTASLVDLATYLQAQLEEIGINVSINPVESATYLEMTGDGETEMFIGTWGTVTVDADYGLYPMFHSSNFGAPGNRTFFANEQLDDLLEQARKETDEQKRLALYEEAQNVLAEEAPVVNLYHSVLLAGMGDDIEGFWQYPASIFYLRDTEKVE